MSINMYLLIITLNVNGFNAPIKRHRIAECIRKQDPYIFCLQESLKDTLGVEVKDGKRYFMLMEREKKLGQQYFSDKIDFKAKASVRDQGYYIMIKGAFQQEDITLVNIYAPNTGAPKYVKQILIDKKGEINTNRVIVGGFNIPLTINRSSRQKINMEMAAMNDTTDQMDLINIFRAFHPKAAEYTFFSSTQGQTTLGHKTNLNKFKKTETISSIFSDHNAMKLENNHKKKTKKHTKTLKLNNMLLNNEWVNNGIKLKINIP